MNMQNVGFDVDATALIDESKDTDFLYLKSKLMPQVVSAKLVERSRLIDRFILNDRIPRLVTVTATTGYGKSTLLTQLWSQLKGNGVKTCWLTLDGDDRDRNRLSCYVALSIVEVTGSIDENLSLDPRALSHVSHRAKLTNMFRLLEQANDRFVLFIDDYHLIDDEQTNDLFDWLISSAPPNIHFVIASRKRPGLKICTSLKMKGQFVEVDSRDLSFDLVESAKLLNHDDKNKLCDDLIATLQTRTEGWVAALQLASIALRDCVDLEGFVKGFSGSDRDIVDYLGDAVLTNVSVQDREFLLFSSVLKRFNTNLCIAVTGFENSEKIIQQLERANLFIFALDRGRIWFRYHQLFQEFLIRQLELEYPEETKKNLCRRAGKWFEDRGQLDEAIDYALIGQDYNHAASMVSEFGHTVAQDFGNPGKVLGWVSALPTDIISKHVNIRKDLIWALTFTRQFEEARSELKILEHETLIDGTPSPDEKHAVQSFVDMIEALILVFSDNVVAARKASEKYMDKWPEALPLHKGAVAGVLGLSCFHTFEFERGRQAVKKARGMFDKLGAHYGVIWMDTIYALISLRQGHIRNVISTCTRGLEISNETMGKESYATEMLSIILAEAEFERGNIDIARKLVGEGAIFLDEHGPIETTFTGYIIRARILFRDDRVDEALDLLSTGEEVGRKLGLTRITETISSEKIRFLLWKNRIEEARSIYDEIGFSLSGKKGVANELVHDRCMVQSTTVQLLLADKKTKEALPLLNELIIKARNDKRMRRVVRLLILKAGVYMVNGAEKQSARILEEALELGALYEITAPFVDDLIYIRPTLEAIAKIRSTFDNENQGNIPKEYFDRIKGQCGIEVTKPNKKEADNEERLEPEQLSKREIQLLKMVETGLSNDQIGKVLFISLSTVKWHLSNIYSKMGARNRTDAVATGRRIGII